MVFEMQRITDLMTLKSFSYYSSFLYQNFLL